MADWCVVILSMKHGSCSSDAPLDCSLKRLKKSTYAAIESWRRMKARIIGMPGCDIPCRVGCLEERAQLLRHERGDCPEELVGDRRLDALHRPCESQPLNE